MRSVVVVGTRTVMTVVAQDVTVVPGCVYVVEYQDVIYDVKTVE
jgi:hypothetical protein